jgi:flavin-dependent dehydrogenase
MSGGPYDVIVIGGGPAGATTATLTAKAGHRTVVFDKGRHPRFHIGESLMPDTYWPFERIGMIPKLKASNFVKKFSVQFVSASGRETQPFYFFKVNPHESSQTWQVVRSEFDKMMLDNAADHGAEIVEDAAVTDVILEGSRAVGVKVCRSGGAETEIRGRVVVDGSGQSTVIGRKLGIKRVESRLRNGSIFAHYKNARRDAGIDEGATLVIYTPDAKGWFWYIPLPDNVVSVGIVRPAEVLFGAKDRTPAEILDEQIAACRPLADRLADAWKCSDVHVTRDFSYRSTRCAGDGWTLVGDAFAFLDPIYSSGVFLALKSGEFAADAIIEGLAKGDTSGRQLGSWGPRLCRGMEAIRKIVYAFYTEGFSFGQFRKQHPEYDRHITSLLIGDVFRDESVFDVFGPLGRMVPLPEENALEPAGEPALAVA